MLIRDVAYGMLPKAVRCRKHFEVGRFIEERAGDRSDEVVALLAEHYGRSAALGAEGGVTAAELGADHRARRALPRGGGRRRRAAVRQPRGDLPLPPRAGAAGRATTTPPRRSIGEKQGDVALRLGRVDAAIQVWGECLDHHRREEDLDRVADLHRKLGAALAVKGERKAAIENYQRGINLLKDGPPRLELVRLYEEAAWLYLQTGDNMLAIYASEKALRLAERLGETRAASRAHGIFGRVFGRIGDTEKARSNLERSVELARAPHADGAADHAETILALLALGRHLEISEADARGAGAAYDEALALAEQVGDLPSQVELHSAVAQLAAYRADWEQVRRSTDASADLAEREGLVSKLCLPYALRGLLRWREGSLDQAEERFRRAHELAEQVGWSELSFQALYGLALTLRDRGELRRRRDGPGPGDRRLRACRPGRAVGAGHRHARGGAGAGRPRRGRARVRRRGPGPGGAPALPDRQGGGARGARRKRRGPGQGAGLLVEAEAAWTELERPLEAARCRLLAGFRLRETDPQRATELLESSAEECERLGVAHLATRARALTAA